MLLCLFGRQSAGENRGMFGTAHSVANSLVVQEILKPTNFRFGIMFIK